MFLDESNMLLTSLLTNSLSVEVQCEKAIRIISDKLNDGSLKTKQEKIDYLNKMKVNSKRGCTYRQNKNPLGKNRIQKSYNNLFHFIDKELDKLK